MFTNDFRFRERMLVFSIISTIRTWVFYTFHILQMIWTVQTPFLFHPNYIILFWIF